MQTIKEIQERSWSRRLDKLTHAGCSIQEHIWKDMLRWCHKHEVSRSALMEALCIDWLERHKDDE